MRLTFHLTESSDDEVLLKSGQGCIGYIGYPFAKAAFEKRRNLCRTGSLYTDVSYSLHR
jgi:hypothetical protein